jgi:hypothetical protein
MQAAARTGAIGATVSRNEIERPVEADGKGWMDER